PEAVAGAVRGGMGTAARATPLCAGPRRAALAWNGRRRAQRRARALRALARAGGGAAHADARALGKFPAAAACAAAARACRLPGVSPALGATPCRTAS